jgi:uncharacterized protein YecE (DUF72 family)
MAQVLIGCSGWQYSSWRGSFYPKDLASSRWLQYYTSQFHTVEVNNTFYRLPEKSTFAAWRDATPAGFVVAVKASRYLTHLKRLRQPAAPLSRLLGRVVALGSRLGPILYQLPSTLRYDERRLRGFLRSLAVQSMRIDKKIRDAGEPGVVRLRHVIEFRDPSWYRRDVFEALRKADVAICLHDMPGSEIVDAPGVPFVYVRFHGTAGKYCGSYSNATLRRWAQRLRKALTAGHDVYAYFNNDLGGTAVRDARALSEYVCRP